MFRILGGWAAAATAAVWLLSSLPARAAEGDVAALDEAPQISRTAAAASSGALLAFAQGPSVVTQGSYVTTFGGYDSARETGSFEAAAEVRVYGPLALRGGAVYTDRGQRLRPSFGARLQLMQQGRHGVDGAVGVFYRPEGLTEAEGEIETVVAIGGRVGSAYLLGNLVYGQDPEGRERDGEIRLAALRPVARLWMLGLDGRLRIDLGSEQAILARNMEPTWDVLAGPVATALLGPVGVSVQAGGAGVRLQQRTSYGLFAMAGLGTAF